MNVLVLFLSLSFVACAIAVPFARRLALRRGILDVPNERSSHKFPTPRTGGVGILLGTSVGFAISLWSTSTFPEGPYLTFIIALLGGAVVGFIDDVFKMPTILRLPLYLLIAAAISIFFGHLAVVDIPIAPVVSLGVIGGVIFSSLFIAWYTNLFNFMDGIDGIAGGAALVTLGSLATAFFLNGPYLLGALAASAAAAVVGFLLYNYPPAMVFMGDGGSVFLGMAAGSLSLAAVKEGVLSLPASIFLMLPFVFDATFTLFRRIFWRERFWTAHRSHVYQQLCDLGFSHRTVTIIYTVAAVIFAAIGLSFDRWTHLVQAFVWWGFLIALLFVSIIVVKKNRDKARLKA